MHYHQLTEVERYQIYTLKREGYSQRLIAKKMNRSHSTICREFNRNRGGNGWRPGQAQRMSDRRRQAAGKAIKMTAHVRAQIDQLITQDLSPQQTAFYLQIKGIETLHHETIYQYVYRNKAQGGELYKHLRVASKPYRKRYGCHDRRDRIRNRTSIETRPQVIEDRKRIGDWEGDTVIGKGQQGVLLTLVERKTLYTIIVPMEDKQAKPMAAAIIEALTDQPHPVHSITFDNGLEFAAHETVAEQLKTRIYFAHPYASWERGTNENTNGLIRQYLPKKTSLKDVTRAQTDFIMQRLNNRPRLSRGGKTPNEMYLGQTVDLLVA